jgi:hypothetical protein
MEAAVRTEDRTSYEGAATRTAGRFVYQGREQATLKKNRIRKEQITKETGGWRDRLL